MNKLPNYDPAEHTPRPEDRFMTRRDLLRRTGMGMGTLSLAMLLGESMVSTPAVGAELAPAARSGRSALAPRRPQFAGKAKRVSTPILPSSSSAGRICPRQSAPASWRWSGPVGKAVADEPGTPPSP
jgi:hypothetical protein